MPSTGSLSRALTSTATYWAPSSTDQYGDTTFAAPLELSAVNGTGVRWEEASERFVNVNERGDQEQGRAKVWTLHAVVKGGYLYLGSSSATNPETVSGADQIRRVEFVSDLHDSVRLYKAFL